jgi:hypothetical protein
VALIAQLSKKIFIGKRRPGTVVNTIDDTPPVLVVDSENDPVRKINQMPDFKTDFPFSGIRGQRSGISSSE